LGNPNKTASEQRTTYFLSSSLILTIPKETNQEKHHNFTLGPVYDFIIDPKVFLGGGEQQE
jgi:hypothetical protein